MFFSLSDDDDGGAFSAGTGSTKGSKSNLSSLFGMGNSKQGNESLMYNAPKQPKQKNEEAAPNESKSEAPPALLFACAVHTFKLTNGQYAEQGKLGAAILGNFAKKDYKVLLYVSQKKPVTNATITPQFLFNVQKGNYATFYDDQSINWSLRFENEEKLLEFSKWIGVARYNVSGGLVTQELNYAEGQEVARGDTLEMVYTGWLLNSGSFGKIFDTNTNSGKLFKFKVGKGKVIKGWDEGIIGAKKSSKRLLVIPPSLAYGSKAVGDRVPPNSTLIFQVEVTRVKFSNPQQADVDTVSIASSSMASIASVDTKEDTTTEPLNIAPAANEDEDVILERSDSLRDRTKSIEDHLQKSSQETTKSKLLERMSKMGRSMMPASPVHSGSFVEPTKQEETSSSPSPEPTTITEHQQQEKRSEVPHKPVIGSPKPSIRARPDTIPARPVMTPPPVQNYPEYPPQINPLTAGYPQVNPQQLALYQSPHQQHAAMFAPTMFQQPPATTTTEVNLMMTDGRLKHTEVKSDLSRILDKLDALSTAVTQINHKSTMVERPAEMEASVIMHNITRIIQENEKYRSECEEKRKKIELLNERMSDLLTKNQSYLERSNALIATQTDTLQTSNVQANAKLASLEDQNMKLETDLSTTKKQLVQLHAKYGASQQEEAQLNNKLLTLEKQLKQHRQQAEDNEHESALEEVKTLLNKSKKENKQLKTKMESIEEEQGEIGAEKENLEKILLELKKRRKEDRQKFLSEVEDMKSQHEDELTQLQAKLRKINSGETTKALQLEEDVRKRVEDEFASKLQLAETNYNTKIETLSKEKLDVESTLNNRIQELEEKLLRERESFQSNSFTEDEKNNNLQKEVERLTRQLESKDLAGKSVISDLQTEVERLQRELEKVNEDKNNLTKKVSQFYAANDKQQNDITEAYDKGIADGRGDLKTISAAAYERGLSEGKDVSQEVKKVMSSVFFKLKGEFEVEEEYNGKEVVASVLSVIKEVTLKLTKEKEDEESSEEEESGDESDDEEGVANNDESSGDESVANKDEKSGEESGQENVAPQQESEHESDTINKTTPEENEQKYETSDTVSTEQPGSVDEVAKEESGNESDDQISEVPSTTAIVESLHSELNNIAEVKKLSEQYPDDTDNQRVETKTNDVIESDKIEDESLNKSADCDRNSESFAHESDLSESADRVVEENENNSPKIDEATSEKISSDVVSETLPSNNAKEDKSSAIKSERTESLNALEEVGLDSSLFSPSVDSSEASVEKPPVKKADPLAPSDDDDDDDFFLSKPSQSSGKSSAFDRSPPPLFDDDDDDTNWI